MMWALSQHSGPPNVQKIVKNVSSLIFVVKWTLLCRLLTLCKYSSAGLSVFTILRIFNMLQNDGARFILFPFCILCINLVATRDSLVFGRTHHML